MNNKNINCKIFAKSKKKNPNLLRLHETRICNKMVQRIGVVGVPDDQINQDFTMAAILETRESQSLRICFCKRITR